MNKDYELIGALLVLAVSYVAFRLMYRAITGGWDVAPLEREEGDDRKD
tara:strand:+ start:16717 stop:16860 length:144 start_codon:yes stop_codon:yes gene_type:complete